MEATPAILRERQRLIQELREVQAALSSANDSQHHGLYANLPPGAAIRKFLADEGRPCDRKTIIWSLIAGRANVGAKDPENNIDRAIDVNLELGLLRDYKGKIGLPEWQMGEWQRHRGEKDPRVRRVIELIHSEVDRPLSLTDLAARVELSPSRLSHLFQRDVGMAPRDYLRRVKMRVFRSMLQKSCLKQKQILSYLGITDRSHFSKQFKQMFRRSPSEMRKNSGFCPAIPQSTRESTVPTAYPVPVKKHGT